MNQETKPLKGRSPFVSILLNIIQLFGIFAAALAYPSPETVAVLQMLPDAIAAKIGTVAVFLLAMKPAINIFGDLLDNGALDGSYKDAGKTLPLIMIFAALSALSFSLVSCGGVVSIQGDERGISGSYQSPNGLRVSSTYVIPAK
jgi:hypothetical protein